jgi:hypothetical protein
LEAVRVNSQVSPQILALLMFSLSAVFWGTASPKQTPGIIKIFYLMFLMASIDQ